MALSSLPCLTPPFMSASLAMLSFPPLPLLSLHLASFPCLPPSPSRCTWLCWLPLHHSCRPPQGPCAFIPWPPATCSPLHWRPAPTAALPFHHLLPHLKTSHCHGVKKRSGTKPPRVFSIHVQKALPSFFHQSCCPHQAASRVISLPRCVLHCHSQASSCLIHLPHQSDKLEMLVDPDVPPCHQHPPFFSSAPAGGQKKGTSSCSNQDWALPKRGLWLRDKGKWWAPCSHELQTCARHQCPLHTLQEA